MMSIRAAVWAALDVLGDQTSVEELRKRASMEYGESISYGTTVLYRRTWRYENGIETDCRTYKGGQPRRNMLNDDRTDLDQVTRLSRYFTNKTSTPKTLLTLLGDGKGQFHSVEQLKNALGKLSELQLKRAA